MQWGLFSAIALVLDFFCTVGVAKMAYLHPCGHDNSSLGKWIFTKIGTHMLHTITKDEFKFRGRTYFSDFKFSRIFFRIVGVAILACLDSGLGQWICTNLHICSIP